MARFMLIETDGIEETREVAAIVRERMGINWRGGAGASPLPISVPERGTEEMGRLPAGEAPAVDEWPETATPVFPEAQVAAEAAPTGTALTGEDARPTRTGRRGSAEPRARTAAGKDARATTEGEHRCPEEGCERSFGTAQGLGRHRFSAHGIAGSSWGAKHSRQKREMAVAAKAAPTKSAAAPTRLEREGLTADAEGKVVCPKCEQRIDRQGFSTHMAMHDREAVGTAAGKDARATGERKLQRRPRVVRTGVGGRLTASVLPPTPMDSRTGIGGGEEDEDGE